jgi:4-amino-4-deoxy-L-arabinose transferase-like glycosyltransferase
VETIKNNDRLFLKMSAKRFNLIILGVILLSIVPRLISIDQNLLDIQPFRQTQTAITVWNYTQEGFNFFNYQTPIFGPPYQAPFELPVFQSFAFFFTKLGVNNIEVACRLANILFYALSALLLTAVVSKLIKNKLITFLSLFQYCFIPFAICWSRNVTIEYCSLAFCLFYVFLFLKIREITGIRSYLLIAFTCIIGCFAYSIKLTTAFPFVLLIFILFVYDILKENIQIFKEKKFLKFIFSKTSFKYAVIVFFVFLVPFIMMYLWVRHSDILKMQSAFSYITTSSSLRDWNFGTWDDKTTISNWFTLFNRIGFGIVPFTLLITAFLSFIKKELRSIQVKLMFLLLLVFTTIFIFFNLYFVHDYYLVAVLPFLSVCFALAFYLSQNLIQSLGIFKNKYGSVIILLVIICFPFLHPKGMDFSKEYTRFIWSKTTNSDYPQFVLGQEVQKQTKNKEKVIFTDYEWSSEMLYYSRRKGLMWTTGNETEIGRFEKDLRKEKYSLIVSKNPDLYPNLISKFKVLKKMTFHSHTFIFIQ